MLTENGKLLEYDIDHLTISIFDRESADTQICTALLSIRELLQVEK
jgi:hypothetical protein